jgi:hypothetical protein
MSKHQSALVGGLAGAMSALVVDQLKGVNGMSVLACRLIGAAVGISFYLGVTTYLRHKRSN